MKSCWNYRVMRKKSKNGEVRYAIHETYYDGGKVTGWTRDAIGPRGDTLAELKNDYKFMASALKKPVLDYETGKEIKP